MSITADALLVTQRLIKCLPQCNTDILYGVVRIDVQIPFCGNGEVQQTMAGDLIQHVLEERHTGIQLRISAALQAQTDLYLRLKGITLYL